jgi:phosphoribosylglycinamide formyltransferase-1
MTRAQRNALGRMLQAHAVKPSTTLRRPLPVVKPRARPRGAIRPRLPPATRKQVDRAVALLDNRPGKRLVRRVPDEVFLKADRVFVFIGFALRKTIRPWGMAGKPNDERRARVMTEPLRIGVLGSHGGSNMQAIIDAIEAGSLAARIVLVISNNSSSGAMDRAWKHGLPSLHLSSAIHPEPAALDRAIRDALLHAKTDVVVLAGYMKKIGPVTLASFRGRILNIHPALLPRHGGPGMYGIHPHESVLAAGDAESGVTVHVIDEHYDQGRILRQERVPVLPDDTPAMLQQRVLAVEHQIYVAVLKDVAAGKIQL